MHSIPSPRWLILGLLASPLALGAEDVVAQVHDTGDTAWMIVATCLVLFMTLPGLALFYGGLVRSKNVLSVLGHCLMIAGIMSLLWVAYGYSIAFTGDNPFIGGFDKAFLRGVTPSSFADPAHRIPEPVYLTFQMTFGIITPALIVGAFAERMKFAAILIFTVIWFTFSFLPIWHMAWAGSGLFLGWGALDFAGGTVVHINAGIAALVACIMVGKRRGYPQDPIKPHSLVLTVIGTGMLWVGWFGFNAGSQLAADGTAGMAMLVTQVATAAALVVWALIEKLTHGKASILGMATGAVAGLVAITPASGTAGPMGAMLIGAVAALVCWFCASRLKARFGYDDSLDVFGVHGVGGIVGALLTGLCAAPFMGGSGLTAATVGAQIWTQLLTVLVTIGWSAVVSVVALLIAKVLVGLRVQDDIEDMGLDLGEHDERGYVL